MRRAGLGLLACVALAACEKVPIVNINASFTIADAAWFEEEQTLFLFYTVNAEQGLSEDSQIEIAYRTDAFFQDWTDVAPLPKVHQHLPVDCGPNTRCGSLSLHVPLRPLEVGFRLRYHREGEVFLNAQTRFNAIATGPAHSNRSLVVYGVFDETNARVQWRARHQFPTLHNEEAEALGLRRHFEVADRSYGDPGVGYLENPYGYGATGTTCPASLTALPPLTLQTSTRAVFESIDLPIAATPAPAVCAVSTVTDATGTFQAVAFARKNPEVRPAFPLLRTPIRINQRVPFLLRMCAREISPEHLAMQEQRVLLDAPNLVCLDDWRNDTFATELASRFRDAIDAARGGGQDMVLTIALHHDSANGALAAVIETALSQVLVPERDKASPHLSGAFVLDSFAYIPKVPEVNSLVLWCPPPSSFIDLDDFPEGTAVRCPPQADIPDIELGPFRFSNLPILPSRAQYLTFIGKYSDAQGGRMKDLVFRAPERTALSDNVAVPPFGVATFFNNEVLTADPDDAFSFADCSNGEVVVPNVVFRTTIIPDVFPISVLPDLHAQLPQSSYQLGLAWDFPFLLRMTYETFAAGSATAYDFTVPFGIGVTTEQPAGTELWTSGDFRLDQVLQQCTRFCDHPTFDHTDEENVAGVYNVLSLFREAYRAQCYRPTYPAPSQGLEGFPHDP